MGLIFYDASETTHGILAGGNGDGAGRDGWGAAHARAATNEGRSAAPDQGCSSFDRRGHDFGAVRPIKQREVAVKQFAAQLRQPLLQRQVN